jgi:hypothetical protein
MWQVGHGSLQRAPLAGQKDEAGIGRGGEVMYLIYVMSIILGLHMATPVADAWVPAEILEYQAGEDIDRAFQEWGWEEDQEDSLVILSPLPGVDIMIDWPDPMEAPGDYAMAVPEDSAPEPEGPFLDEMDQETLRNLLREDVQKAVDQQMTLMFQGTAQMAERAVWCLGFLVLLLTLAGMVSVGGWFLAVWRGE